MQQLGNSQLVSTAAKFLRPIFAFLVIAFVAGIEVALAAPVSGMGTWETVLKARGIDGRPTALDDSAAVFFYDTQLDITWLADFLVGIDYVNGSATASRFQINGIGGWRNPYAWNSLNCTSSEVFVLPFNVPCSEFPRAVPGLTNEWAHLYYDVLGNKSDCISNGTGSCAPGTGLVNTGYFRMGSYPEVSGTGIRISAFHTGLIYADPADPIGGHAWYFDFLRGATGKAGIDDLEAHVTLVRPGDIFRALPEPGTLILVGLALSASIAARRWRMPAARRLHSRRVKAATLVLYEAAIGQRATVGNC